MVIYWDEPDDAGILVAWLWECEWSRECGADPIDYREYAWLYRHLTDEDLGRV